MENNNIVISTFLEHRQKGMNLVGFLAKQDNKKLVDKLLTLGAQRKDAIYGYAISNNKTQVTLMLNSCQLKELVLFTRMAVRGYARGGHLNSIYEIENYKNYTPDIILGSAQAGNAKHVHMLLKKDINLYPHAVEGYASTNQKTLLLQLIQGTSYAASAVFNAARSGHSDLVTTLFKSFNIDENRQLSSSLIRTSQTSQLMLLNEALRGYCNGRHFEEAAILMSRGGSISVALSQLREQSSLPSHNLYYCLLAHIQSKDLRTLILNKISIQSQLLPHLEIKAAELNQAQSIAALMKTQKLNFIEASKLATNPMAESTGEEITLDFLVDSLPDTIKTSSMNGLIH